MGSFILILLAILLSPMLIMSVIVSIVLLVCIIETVFDIAVSGITGTIEKIKEEQNSIK